jgi:hypothetical protein
MGGKGHDQSLSRENYANKYEINPVTSKSL